MFGRVLPGVQAQGGGVEVAGEGGGEVRSQAREMEGRWEARHWGGARVSGGGGSARSV